MSKPPAPAERKRHRLSALVEVDFAGLSSTTEVLERATELATELLPATLGASAAFVDSDGTFRVLASTVSGQDDGSTLSSDGVTAKIFATSEPVVVRDVADAPVPKGSLAEASGVVAYIGVPISYDERCLGVLYVLDSAPRSYTADDVAFLELLAGRAAAAVHNAGIFSEMRAARERSEALAWVANAVIAAEGLDEVLGSVVEGVAAAVAADAVDIVTVDREGARILGFARSGGVDEPPELDEPMSAAVGDGRLRLAEEGGDPRVITPLRAGASVLGVMSVHRSSGRFEEAEIDLIMAMANQVAIAIDNVRLLETTRSTLRETEAMYGMAQTLVAGGDLPEILDAVALGAMEALPAAGSRILMADTNEITAQAVAGSVIEGEMDELFAGDVGQVLHTEIPIHRKRQLTVPLALHGRLLGTIEATNGPEDPEFTVHQLGTLQAAAAQAAVAIENHMLFGEVQRLAITDELTGVNSRRHLFELGQREFAQAIRFRKPLSAMMFDLDHFKEVNDTLGHLVGDEVLEGVAQRCANVLREVDVLGRYGGEEFAVILPDATAKDAMMVAERVRKAVASDSIETARGPVAVTVSVGVAEVSPGVLDLKTLLDKADVAMYAAKQAGRDQVIAA